MNNITSAPFFVVLLLTISASAAAQNPEFLNPQINFGGSPLKATALDINNDGNMDVVGLGNAGSLQVSQLVTVHGDGMGHWAWNGPLTIGGPTTATDLDFFDVNLDGKLDAVVISNGNPFAAGPIQITYFAGNGIHFNAGVAMTLTTGSTNCLTHADFNNDGFQDAAVGHSTAGKVSLVLGTGTGFAGSPTLLTVPNKVSGVAAANLNNDGAPDLIVANEITFGSTNIQGNIHNFINNGSGTLTNTFFMNVGVAAAPLVAADVNGDGITDAVFGRAVGAKVTVLLGNGAGGAAALVSSPTGGADVASICINDVNNDGKPDLGLGLTSSLLLSINQGGGSFAPGNGPTTFTSNVTSTLADFNHDGNMDFATVYISGRLVSHLGAAGLTFPSNNYYPTGTSPTAIAVLDADRDGKADLATVNFGNQLFGASLTLNRGNGAGGFLPKTVIAAAANNTIHFTSIAAADFNNDLNPDLIITMDAPNNATLYLGNGNGTFAGGQTIATGAAPSGIVVSDFSGDGIADFVTTNSGAATISTILSTGPAVFAPKFDSAVGANPRTPVAADFNLDGLLDVAVCNGGGHNISVLLANGSGAWLPHTTWTAGNNPTAIATHDLNDDGAPDIAATGNGGYIPILFNAGNGTFPPFVAIPTKEISAGIFCNDFTGDGIVDLATLSAGGFNTALELKPGTGGGAFGQSRIYCIDSGGAGAAIADFNADGRQDIVTTTASFGNIIVALNQKPTPQGILAYAPGTPGCGGPHGLVSISTPNIGNAQYGYVATNAPADSLGVFIATDSKDAAGSYLFGLDTLFYMDFTNATEIYAFDFPTDRNGYGRFPAPLPNIPALVGNKYYAQGFFYWGASCGATFSGLTSSRAIEVTILP